LKQRGITATKKMFVAEVVDFMRYPWLDPIMAEKPETLVFIGYNPKVAAALASAVKEAETVVLSNVEVKQATHSQPDTSPRGWQQSLEQLIQALGG
jgi:CO dehydrogenase/acetyl-CoA synthase epsilon subunit